MGAVSWRGETLLGCAVAGPAGAQGHQETVMWSSTSGPAIFARGVKEVHWLCHLTLQFEFFSYTEMGRLYLINAMPTLSSTQRNMRSELLLAQLQAQQGEMYVPVMTLRPAVKALLCRRMAYCLCMPTDT